VTEPRALTEYEVQVLDRLDCDEGREKHGEGPWERAWCHGRTAAESAAMGRLYSLGLVERRPGRHSAKLGHGYRSKLPVEGED
jgi:hypothetical protein